MTFATDIAAIPYAPTQAEPKGFLPPLARTLGHLMFTLEAIAAEREIPEDELLGELTHARDHWNALDHGGSLSAPTATTITAISKALGSAVEEFGEWDKDQRVRNVRDLGNRVAGYTAALDRELLGLRGSDPGHQL
jgi:hypothetical protein